MSRKLAATMEPSKMGKCTEEKVAEQRADGDSQAESRKDEAEREAMAMRAMLAGSGTSRATTPTGPTAESGGQSLEWQIA